MAELQKDIISLNNSILAIDGNVLSVTPPPPEDVQIGSQIWKTKNLAIDDGLGGIYKQTVDYGEGPVLEYYYTWEAALRVSATVPGWHLPTLGEYSLLEVTVGREVAGKKLKSTYGWNYRYNGTDDYGFSAFPAGGYWYLTNTFEYFGERAMFWTSSEISYLYTYYIKFDRGATMTTPHGDKDTAYSVRLIKN